MKIIYKQGNLLECSEPAIVHGCNAQGVMGSGVALAVKEKYPEAYKAYLATKKYDGMKLGGVSYWHDNGFYVFNAITQQFYGRNKHVTYVSYDAIAEVFNMLNMFCKENVITSIAMPKIGAGLANGDWNIIEKIIEEECTDVQPVVYVLGDDK